MVFTAISTGNVMHAGGGGSSGSVLIDLALTHAGHWVEDAVHRASVLATRTSCLASSR